MKAPAKWLPPGKNCGMCGEPNCDNFLKMIQTFQKEPGDCPFFNSCKDCNELIEKEACYPETDILGNPYDFVLTPLPGELSARKIVLPFRGDLVEKMEIKPGDYVLGRPMGAGCPIPHILKIIEADPVTGLLTTWVVGPRFSRDAKVKDVKAYHMIGFEGIANRINREPIFGTRATFLPGFCMMSINHTGLVNMVLDKNNGLHVRIEDILILAGQI